MAFDWTLYLTLAEELNEFHNDQAKLRTAISRAYYSAFIKCRTKAGLSTNTNGEVHLQVINYYKSQMDSNSFTVGNNLDSLRRIRNQADYDGHFETTWQLVQKQITLAKSIIENLNSIDS